MLSAILKKRTLCLSELARTYPTPNKRRVAAPKHRLLHRFKRLWRFRLARVRCPERLSCLLMALTIALSWLTPMGPPETGAVPSRWHGGRPAREGERA